MYGSWFRVLGFTVHGLRFRVYGLWLWTCRRHLIICCIVLLTPIASQPLCSNVAVVCLVWSATSVVVVPPPPPPPGGGGDDPTRWKHDGATTSCLQSCDSRLNA